MKYGSEFPDYFESFEHARAFLLTPVNMRGNLPISAREGSGSASPWCRS